MCMSVCLTVTQVRIALQMEDGSRLQGSFSCGQSLWEVLTHFPEMRCVYVPVQSVRICVLVSDGTFLDCKYIFVLAGLFES